MRREGDGHEVRNGGMKVDRDGCGRVGRMARFGANVTRGEDAAVGTEFVLSGGEEDQVEKVREQASTGGNCIMVRVTRKGKWKQ